MLVKRSSTTGQLTTDMKLLQFYWTLTACEFFTFWLSIFVCTSGEWKKQKKTWPNHHNGIPHTAYLLSVFDLTYFVFVSFTFENGRKSLKIFHFIRLIWFTQLNSLIERYPLTMSPEVIVFVSNQIISVKLVFIQRTWYSNKCNSFNKNIQTSTFT